MHSSSSRVNTVWREHGDPRVLVRKRGDDKLYELQSISVTVEDGPTGGPFVDVKITGRKVRKNGLRLDRVVYSETLYGEIEFVDAVPDRYAAATS